MLATRTEMFGWIARSQQRPHYLQEQYCREGLNMNVREMKWQAREEGIDSRKFC